jgi:predicted nucleic acid-binding protein
VPRRLIDTDVMIDASRGRPGVAAIIDSSEDVTISIVTALELIVGARNQRDAESIDGLIKAYALHTELDARITGLAYELLKRHAKPDGLRTFDALIAATAIREGFTLVSRNRKHYQMIRELSLEVPEY